MAELILIFRHIQMYRMPQGDIVGQYQTGFSELGVGPGCDLQRPHVLSPCKRMTHL